MRQSKCWEYVRGLAREADRLGDHEGAAMASQIATLLEAHGCQSPAAVEKDERPTEEVRPLDSGTQCSVCGARQP